ncbi:fimbrial chaperone [Salmonella enterica subsp. enterica serovar Kotte]|nr:fimbrial chaperone [Salmonella enterica subsp. enterica serovar Kotte]
MSFSVKKIVSTLLISGLLVSPYALADIIISGTRVIYNADKKDVSIRLENKGNRPLLVQNWLDIGDDNADPSEIHVPFTSTPPVSRIEPKRGQTVKVMFTGAKVLPNDRESVYWFNVLEVPPKAKNDKDPAANKNLLQLAFRTRIKLFYRPAGLPGEAAEAPAKLKWQLKTEQGKTQVQVSNPTPYYVSFNETQLENSGKSYKVDSSMVAPFGQASFNITGLKNSLSSGELTFKAINDYGGMINGSASL